MGKNIQKELINGILKHQAKLATTIQEACMYIVNIIRNTGLTVFSLDLANAYANVYHQLIHFTSSGISFDPCLSLNEQPLPFITGA